MFAGHIGAGLALGRVDRSVNVGVLIFCALFLDFLLWLFILFGWESATIPANFMNTHQPEFVFPYSHGLLASIGWSALAGMASFFYFSRENHTKLRAVIVIALAVFSHWLLDALVHAPELPVAGASSMKVGLGLWQAMPVALLIEAFIVVVGLYYYVAGSGISRSKKLWLSTLSLVTLAFTVAGMTVAPAPPSADAMAFSSLVTIAVVCILAGWLGRQPHEAKI